jgi:hypothetical protein
MIDAVHAARRKYGFFPGVKSDAPGSVNGDVTAKVTAEISDSRCMSGAPIPDNLGFHDLLRQAL